MNVLAALLSLIQAHQPPQQQAQQRTVNLVSNPKDHYYTPAQVRNAERSIGPAFTTPTGQYVGPLSATPAPQPIQNAMIQARKAQLQQALQTQPKVPNFRGALPPAMVNVPWSNQQVPYAQSLNPPKGFTGK